MPNSFVPPPRQPLMVPSVAEFFAIRVMVMKLVAIAAETNAAGLPPRDWVNAFAADCSEAILAASFSENQGVQVEQLRAATLDNVNQILSGIRVSESRSNAN